MITADAYSSLRRMAKNKSQDGYSWDAFYDSIIKPGSLLVTIGGYFVLVQKDDLPVQFKNATGGDTNALMHLVLIIFTLFLSFRLIQSLYLAKRDYSDLPIGFLDVITLLLLLWFATGGVLLLVKESLLVLVIYALGAVYGAVHYYVLYRIRFPRNENIDYPIDCRIQMFNALTFAYLAIATGYCAWDVYTHAFPTVSGCFILGLSCLPLVLNMLHSEQLTLIPKFLFQNKPDTYKFQAELFKSWFWRRVDESTDQELERMLGLSVDSPVQDIEIIRAKEDDIPQISTVLLNEFEYVFRYVFGISNRSQLDAGLRTVLSVACGHGSLGYMSFYFIKSSRGFK